MIIFKADLKQLARYIFIWSVILGSCILIFYPIYSGFMLTNVYLPKDFLSDNTLLNTLGINMDYLLSPLGVYAFLTSFVMLACAIQATYLGIRVFVNEYLQKTADFLYTKPFSRASVIHSKISAAMCGIVVMSSTYTLASLWILWVSVPAFDGYVFLLLAFSIFLIQWFFFCIGLLIGALFPRLRTPIMVATGIAFFSYILGSFSRKIQIVWLQRFSPFTYFDMGNLFLYKSYDGMDMSCYVIVCVICVVLAYHTFTKTDVIVTV